MHHSSRVSRSITLAGVGEIARQFRERAVDHARPLAEIALLQRDLVRTGRRLPQRLAAVGIEQAGIAPRVFLEHLAIFLDRLFGVVLRGGRHRDKKRTARAATMVVFLKSFPPAAVRSRRFVVVHCWPRARSQAAAGTPQRIVPQYMRFVAWKSAPRPIRGTRLPQPANRCKCHGDRLDTCVKMNMFRGLRTWTGGSDIPAKAVPNAVRVGYVDIATDTVNSRLKEWQ